ncbi:MAG: apolipoprotein N-acyltransferase [Alphaproteobacteria bacterium]
MSDRTPQGRLAALAAGLGRLAGWRRWGAAWLLGAAATLSLPPVDALPALYIAFPGLVWLLAGAPKGRTALSDGWWFGFGYFAVGLYWMGNAMLVDAGRHAWMIPFATLGLPAGIALFPALAAWAAWRLAGPRRSLPGGLLRLALLLAACWTASEWLRGHVLTGFPWNLVGHSWSGILPLLQGAAVLGIYGLSLLAATAAVLPAAAAGASRRHALTLLGLGLAIPVAAGAAGALRLAAAASPGTDVLPDVGLRIVQSGIPQAEKWDPALRVRNFRRYLEMSRADRPDWVTHIVWPETAAPFPVDLYPDARRAMAAVAPPGGLILTGTPRQSREPAFQVWNSVVAVDDEARVVGSYDKFHLVPFGEYVPLADILPIRQIAGGSTGFSAGPGPRTLRLPGLPPVSPLICYEAIFPGAVLDPKDRPQWLLNLTNDAWYGRSAGPYQHFAIARVRAVEEGLALVRAANTGISAVFDPYGRSGERLPLIESGVLDTRIPSPLPGLTPYARWGDGPFAMLLAGLFGLGLSVARAHRMKSRSRGAPA